MRVPAAMPNAQQLQQEVSTTHSNMQVPFILTWCATRMRLIAWCHAGSILLDQQC